MTLPRFATFVLFPLFVAAGVGAPAARADPTQPSFAHIKQDRLKEIGNWRPSARRDAFYNCIAEAESLRGMRECKNAMRVSQFENFGRFTASPRGGIRTSW